MIGQNTASSEQLRSYVERIENVRAQKKQLGLDEGEIAAEAKANGFTPSAIKAVVKIRAMKPHDRQESEALLDMYLHAMGMASEPPLFRAMRLAGTDTTVRDQVIERMKDFVPPSGLGDITVNMDGKMLRLLRGPDGEVEVQEVIETKAKEPVTKEGRKARQRPDVPNVDAKGAEDLGRQYARDNRPVIENPFPHDDARRARFDKGWRDENGGDGMGEE